MLTAGQRRSQLGEVFKLSPLKVELSAIILKAFYHLLCWQGELSSLFFPPYPPGKSFSDAPIFLLYVPRCPYVLPF